MNIELVKQTWGSSKYVLVRLSDGDIEGVASNRHYLMDRIGQKRYAKQDYDIMTVRQYEKKYKN